jgi:hypothetical protein
MDWEPVTKPAEIVEENLPEAILSGQLPINSNFPSEPELSKLSVLPAQLSAKLSSDLRMMGGWIFSSERPIDCGMIGGRATWMAFQRWRV